MTVPLPRRRSSASTGPMHSTTPRRSLQWAMQWAPELTARARAVESELESELASESG